MPTQIQLRHFTAVKMHNKPRVSRDPRPVRCFIEESLRYLDAVVHLQILSSQARILRVYVPGIKKPSPQIKHYKNRLYKSTGRFRVISVDALSLCILKGKIEYSQNTGVLLLSVV